jgi:hypothetical protein
VLFHLAGKGLKGVVSPTGAGVKKTGPAKGSAPVHPAGATAKDR